MSDTLFINSDSSGEASSELHLQTAEHNGKKYAQEGGEDIKSIDEGILRS